MTADGECVECGNDGLDWIVYALTRGKTGAPSPACVICCMIFAQFMRRSNKNQILKRIEYHDSLSRFRIITRAYIPTNRSCAKSYFIE